MIKKRTLKKLGKGVFFTGYFCVLLGALVLSRIAVPAAVEESMLPSKIFIPEIFPEYDNLPQQDAFVFEGREIFPAFHIKAQEDYQGQLLEFYDLSGLVFPITAKSPYGVYTLALGLHADGRVSGVRLVEASEPRGIGRALREAEFFWENFKGKNKEELFLVSEGGKIAPVVGAVEITKRITEAVREGTETYLARKEALRLAALRDRRSFDELKLFQEAPVLLEESDYEESSSELF